jgi:hypothetical protein
VTRATTRLIDALGGVLGPPVATPEFVCAANGKLDRARYRVFRWVCPSCGGGRDDPELIWRPFVVDSDGRVFCEARYCSEEKLVATLRTLLGIGS